MLEQPIPLNLTVLYRVDPDGLAGLDEVAGDAVVSAPFAECGWEALERQGREGQLRALTFDQDHGFGGHDKSFAS